MICFIYYSKIPRKVNSKAKNSKTCFVFSSNVIYSYQTAARSPALRRDAHFPRKDFFRLKTISRVILSAALLLLTGLMLVFAKAAPDVVFSFYSDFSRAALRAIGKVTGLVPIAVWELLAALLILWLIYTFIRVFTRRRSLLSWLAGVLLAVCTGLFLFVGLWGLNHFGPSIDQTLGLDVREYSKQELTDATAYYAAQLNACAETVARNEDGLAVMPEFSELSAHAADGYAQLAQTYNVFADVNGPVKPLASWRLFSQTGTTGIFLCFTAESCVNPDTYSAWLPFTMCHELAHRQAVAAEDGANFCAYLACMASSEAVFRYSGAYGAYIYCHNALSKVDQTAAAQIWNTLSPGALADIRAANAHYAQYEGKVQDAAQKVNDTYLKAFSEEAGVQSYGEVADLLIAWYLRQTA